MTVETLQKETNNRFTLLYLVSDLLFLSYKVKITKCLGIPIQNFIETPPLPNPRLRFESPISCIPHDLQESTQGTK